MSEEIKTRGRRPSFEEKTKMFGTQLPTSTHTMIDELVADRQERDPESDIRKNVIVNDIITKAHAAMVRNRERRAANKKKTADKSAKSETATPTKAE
jgi:hypothetical protein